jgi:hypothetical protein
MLIPKLLLIAGAGTKSGKTTMVCRIIEQFRDLKIAAIKITPHFHETTPGLILKSEKKGYSIYEETNRDGPKDTARMLNSGAEKVFFAKVLDDKLPDAFFEILDLILSDVPVICESPALRNFIEPGLFIIMTSDTINKHKDIKHLQALHHLMIKLEDLADITVLPIGFEDGKWFLKSEA